MAYVYILENKVAGRIKIGATFNHPDDRLLDISRMWRAIKGRCQICLSWRMLNNGRMPNHVLSMNHCTGSGELPLEYSTHLAHERLLILQEDIKSASGHELIAATKRIKNLKKILHNYNENPIRFGEWEIKTTFKTDSAYSVEEQVHQELAKYLDKEAPFGEVFNFPADEAIAVVRNAISQLGKI